MDNAHLSSQRARLPRALPAFLITGLMVAGLVSLGMRSFDWFLLKQSLRARFPDVQWITTKELAAWLSDTQRKPPILLDVRTIEEWNVSHIPGARRVDPHTSGEAALPGVSKGAPIVAYCAVGYRSAEMARRLRKAGFTQVQDLEGSIFAWANEHRPLVRDGKSVRSVHPYNAFWGRLLKDDVRAPMK